jgi:hypothetical protein
MKPSNNHDLFFQQLLLQELIASGLKLDSRNWIKDPLVINEIEFAIKPEIHEGSVYSYGVVFTESIEDYERHEIIPMPIHFLHFARKMSDGIDWFILFEKCKFIGMIRFPSSLSIEIQILKRFPVSGGLMIQRNESGACRFYQGDQIILHDRRNWITKPDIKTVVSNAYFCVNQLNRKILQNLLELAFHLVSPTNGAGAILIWNLENLKLSNPIENLNLSVMNESHLKLIFHLIRQNDGATLFNTDGLLSNSGLQIRYSSNSKKFIPNYKGTRHTSSIRYSYDAKKAVVITVSEDGPVSVFVNGVNLIDQLYESVYQITRKTRALFPSQKEWIQPFTIENTCKKCSKIHIIDGVTFHDHNRKIKVHCPTCRSVAMDCDAFAVQVKPYLR